MLQGSLLFDTLAMTSVMVTVFGVSEPIGSAVACDLARHFNVKGVSYDVNSSCTKAVKTKGMAPVCFRVFRTLIAA